MQLNGGVAMGKVLMIYTSQTGNTEMLTDMIAHELQQLSLEVEMKTFDLDLIDIEQLSNYDAVLIGTYTWDDGELPYESEDFYVDLEGVNLNGQVFGVYGSGDTCYDTFGLAIDLIGDRLKNLGATMVPERLKVDLSPNKEDVKRSVSYAKLVVKTMQVNSKKAV